MFNTHPEPAKPFDNSQKKYKSKDKPQPNIEITYQEPQGEDSGNPELPFISEETPSLSLLHLKIQDTLQALNQMKQHPGKTRQFYLEELVDMLCQCYGYSKPILELFLNQFSPNELFQYIEAQETPRPITLRANTLKSRRTDLIACLVSRGVDARPMAEWSKVAVQVYSSKVPLGATIEYLSGMYMLQSASSLLPVMALSPQPGERILDMAAAPGGKTTYIAQLMKNQGIIVANDSKKERLPSLKYNLLRMGVTNAIVTHYDGRKFPKILKGFDRVLLDAPCTGLGIISRDPSIKAKKGLMDVKKAQHLQKELILAAIDCTKVGGIIAYSTCSVTVQEDEWVIDFALRNRFVKVVDIGLEIGEPGYTKMLDKRFNQTITKARRVYPHIHNMDGFFVCKLRKIKDGSRKPLRGVEEKKKLEEENQAQIVVKNKQEQKKIKANNKQTIMVKKQKVPKVEEVQNEVVEVKKKQKKQKVAKVEVQNEVVEVKKKQKKQKAPATNMQVKQNENEVSKISKKQKKQKVSNVEMEQETKNEKKQAMTAKKQGLVKKLQKKVHKQVVNENS